MVIEASNEDFQQLFFGAKYTNKTIKAIIQDFLEQVRDLTLTRRFNMFLYPHQFDYLNEAAKREGVNMSEYIRKLINTDSHTTNPLAPKKP